MIEENWDRLSTVQGADQQLHVTLSGPNLPQGLACVVSDCDLEFVALPSRPPSQHEDWAVSSIICGGKSYILANCQIEAGMKDVKVDGLIFMLCIALGHTFNTVKQNPLR